MPDPLIVLKVLEVVHGIPKAEARGRQAGSLILVAWGKRGDTHPGAGSYAARRAKPLVTLPENFQSSHYF